MMKGLLNVITCVFQNVLSYRHLYRMVSSRTEASSWFWFLGFFRGKGHLGGSQYQFSCERGYSLVGAETLVCKDAGI